MPDASVPIRFPSSRRKPGPLKRDPSPLLPEIRFLSASELPPTSRAPPLPTIPPPFGLPRNGHVVECGPGFLGQLLH